jgi:hypothetical protein
LKVGGGGLGEEEPAAKVGGGGLGGLPAMAKMEDGMVSGAVESFDHEEARLGAAAVYIASRTVHTSVCVVLVLCKIHNFCFIYFLLIRTKISEL